MAYFGREATLMAIGAATMAVTAAGSMWVAALPTAEAISVTTTETTMKGQKKADCTSLGIPAASSVSMNQKRLTGASPVGAISIWRRQRRSR